MANTKITSRVLADDAVLTANITDANVTTAKIADSNVTVAKMAANSVDSDQYVDGSIDTAHIANDQITTALIADDVALGGNPTTTTQSGSNSSTRIATTAFVQQELTTLIGGAPSTLNDLNELAAAINDDANYNSTLTTALATKLPLAGGTMTGNTRLNDNVKHKYGSGDYFQIYHDGTNANITNGAGHLTIDLTIADKDFIVKGTDGSTDITALTLDMSEAGAATFNAALVVGGDLSIPSTITHVGDTNTKLDFNQADTMRLITGGNTAWICNASSMIINEDSADFDFRVESNNNANMLFVDGGNDKVGIGTASPADRFQVNHTGVQASSIRSSATNNDAYFAVGNSDMSDFILLFGGHSGNSGSTLGWDDSNALRFSTYQNHTGTYGATRMQIDADGTIQLGNPATGAATNVCVMPTGKLFLDAGGNTYIQESSGDVVVFYTGGAERLKLNSNGGEISGALTIDDNDSGQVNNESNVLIRNLADGEIITDDGLKMNCAENKLTVGGGTFITSGHIRSGAANMVLATANQNPHITIVDANGRIDFGESSVSGQGTPRTISHNSNGRSYITGGAEALYLGGATASESGRSNFRISEGNNNMEATIGGDISWVLMHDGKVKYNNNSNYGGHGNFIGEVGTNMKAVMFERTAGGGEVGSIVTNTSSTTYNTSSDYRLKENVDYTWDATTRLKQLKPARFNWISDDSNTLLEGFLAHEVSSIVPEAVYGTKDGMADAILYIEGENLPEGKSVGDTKVASAPDYQGIDHSKLVPLLVKTVQELEARIETLEG